MDNSEFWTVWYSAIKKNFLNKNIFGYRNPLDRIQYLFYNTVDLLFLFGTTDSKINFIHSL